MRTLISEVLLPASAAIGLLALLAIHPATAEDRVPQPEATATLAATSVPLATTGRSAPSSTASARSEAPGRTAIEPRCERVERIGKFKITRCQ
jgi:hypothetical protein